MSGWDVAGRRVLVTGGTSGIGRATAEELARRGAAVTVTARDPERGEQVRAELAARTGRAVDVLTLDLADLGGVRRAADTFRAAHRTLDVLVNNAGLMAGRRTLTADGHELTFQVNHLGPFLLTNLLAEPLAAAGRSRVITVSSDLHRTAWHGMPFEDLDLTRGYSPQRAYAVSKAANVLFTVELQRRWAARGVTARAVHPGVVSTRFGRRVENTGVRRRLVRIASPLMKTPATGARTSVLLATADDATVARALYWATGRPSRASRAATDPAAAQRLWEISLDRVGGLA